MQWLLLVEGGFQPKSIHFPQIPTIAFPNHPFSSPLFFFLDENLRQFIEKMADYVSWDEYIAKTAFVMHYVTYVFIS